MNSSGQPAEGGSPTVSPLMIPLLFLAQIAFLVAFGVLLDTVLVRSLLIPALAYDIGPKIWWPSKLGREPSPR